MTTEFDKYQVKAMEYATAGAGTFAWACYALGLLGEVGEVSEPIKKFVQYRRPLDRDTLAKELGDVLWYVSALATLLGVSLADIAQGNLDKLEQRKRLNDLLARLRS